MAKNCAILFLGVCQSRHYTCISPGLSHAPQISSNDDALHHLAKHASAQAKIRPHRALHGIHPVFEGIIQIRNRKSVDQRRARWILRKYQRQRSKRSSGTSSAIEMRNATATPCKITPLPSSSQELADETNKMSDTAQFLEQQCLPLYYAEAPKEMSHISPNLSMNQKAGYLNMRFKVKLWNTYIRCMSILTYVLFSREDKTRLTAEK